MIHSDPIRSQLQLVATYVGHHSLRHVKQKQATLLHGMKTNAEKQSLFLIFHRMERTGLHHDLNSTRMESGDGRGSC
jgi:hypothetical protein